jgi:hypothetical protein
MPETSACDQTDIYCKGWHVRVEEVRPSHKGPIFDAIEAGRYYWQRTVSRNLSTSNLCRGSAKSSQERLLLLSEKVGAVR